MGNENKFDHFFAVTVGGAIYRISRLNHPQNRRPVVLKVIEAGIEDRLCDGQYLILPAGDINLQDVKMAITDWSGIVIFTEQNDAFTVQPPITEQSIFSAIRLGERTMSITALFFDQPAATECIRNYPGLGLFAWDERWLEITQEVIMAITREDEPICIIDEGVYKMLDRAFHA